MNESLAVGKSTFLVPLNFLNFSEEKHTATAITEESPWKQHSLVITLGILSFPVYLLELLFIQLFIIYWLLLRLSMLDY